MTADHDLLFGVLALQNGLIDQVQLVAAFQAWTRARGQSLAGHLVTRRDLALQVLRESRTFTVEGASAAIDVRHSSSKARVSGRPAAKANRSSSALA